MFGHAPYKGILSHGFTLDGEGRKMSKSIGNIIEPSKIMKQYGADILRLWVSSVDYTADVRVSDSNFKQVSEVYRKIRNTFRFLHGNVSDYNPNTDRVSFEELREIDQFMVMKLQEVIASARKAYEKYDFQGVYHAVNNFCSVELSSFYLDIAKDVVYIEGKNHPHRRAMQTVMYDTLISLAQVMTPIIPHTTDELWSFLEYETEESIQLTDMPEAFANPAFEELSKKWTVIMDFRDDVLKALEEARNAKTIGKSLEAKVTAYVSQEINEIIEAGTIDFAQLMIVSQFVVLTKEEATEQALQLDTSAVLVEPATGEKCERCWTISETVGSNAEHPTLCERCATVVTNEYQ